MKTRGSPALKLLDRWAGIPLLWLLGRRSRRSRPKVIRRIGLLRTAAIGDTLLLAGPLRDLRVALPDATIVLITGEDNAGAGALVAREVADHVPIAVRRPIAAARALRRLELDVLIDTGSWPRMDALIAAWSGARHCVGFRTAGQHRHFCYDTVVDHSARSHEIDNFRALVRAVGARADQAPALNRNGLPDVSSLAPARPFVVLHAWSAGYRGTLKEWPRDRWVALAQRLRDIAPVVVLTGSTSQLQMTRELAEALSAAGVDARVCAGMSFAELAAMLCQCVVLVSVNTGVMHLGAQLGVPTVSLEGPTPPRRWGPVGPRVRSVVAGLPGCGYLHLGFEYRGQRTDCMEGISVDAVERAVRELVRQ